MTRKTLVGLMAVVVLCGSAPRAWAGAILPVAGFTDFNLPANDDDSTGLVPIGFGINFFGVTFTDLYVNNNGNVTFNSDLGQFTPTGITAGSQPTFAPFWADVDTRTVDAGPPTLLTTYGNGTVNGRNAFGVDWIDVGYYDSSPTAARNSFQLILIDRSDIAPGEFDFMFNYDKIQWEAGQASDSDINGCSGTTAHAGWTNGAGTFSELAGSGVHSAFTDPGFCGALAGGANTLTTHSLNSDVAGRYVFTVRGGEVVVPTEPVTTVPEPGSLLLLGTGMSIVGRKLFARKTRG